MNEIPKEQELPAETQEVADVAPVQGLSAAGRQRMMEAPPEETAAPVAAVEAPKEAQAEAAAPAGKPEPKESPDQPEEPLTRAEKGEIGERAMIEQAEAEGRHVLVDHRDNPNAHGFDAIMWDPDAKRLYNCEAKNYKDGSSIGEGSLSALDQRRAERNMQDAEMCIMTSREIPAEERKAALEAVRSGNYTTELWAPEGVSITESAGERMVELGNDISVHTYDSRILQEQERRLREGKR
jgi:hypothetical protein